MRTASKIALLLFFLAAGSLSKARAASMDAQLDAAKREGEVVFNASMNLGEAHIMIAEFEKRYPFIKVKLNRAGSEKLLTRIPHRSQGEKGFRRRHSNRRIQHAYP